MRSVDLTRILALGATIVLSAGCVAHAQGGVVAEADAPVVFTAEPTLVEVDSGIWVVRDYDYPVYYFDDNYWVFRDGIWYRSNSYQGGWVRIEPTAVPQVIIHRDHRAYVHYHGAATAQVKAAPRRGGEHEHHEGPPEHAAEQHGGPPGHDEAHHDKAEEHREHAEEHHEKAEEHREHAEEHARQEQHHEEAKKREEKKDDKKKDDKRKH
jgi:hypothetical protein